MRFNGNNIDPDLIDYCRSMVKRSSRGTTCSFSFWTICQGEPESRGIGKRFCRLPPQFPRRLEPSLSHERTWSDRRLLCTWANARVFINLRRSRAAVHYFRDAKYSQIVFGAEIWWRGQRRTGAQSPPR